jgi:hypothetical protein
MIIEHESHTSQQALIPAREQAWGGTPVHLGGEPWPEQAPREYREEQRRKGTYSVMLAVLIM